MRTIRAIVCAIIFLCSPSIYAGDLGLAGALSGAGQGLGNAASQWQAYELQRQLMEQQAQRQRERDEAMYRMQIERERAASRAVEREQALQAERQSLEAERVKLAHDQAMAQLTKTHPDWRQVVAPDSAYQKWLAAQPITYQRLINASWDPYLIGASIDQFRAASGNK